jgi:hypothetical protein
MSGCRAIRITHLRDGGMALRLAVHAYLRLLRASSMIVRTSSLASSHSGDVCVALSRLLLAASVVLLPVIVEPQPAPSDDVLVQVHVRARDGGGVLGSAYVAAIAPDRTWSQPATEVIALDGIATLRLQPGDYTFVVGAKGFRDERRGIRVIPELSPLTFTLAPSDVMRGTVRDVEGRPLKSARISDARFVMPQVFGAIGSVGRRFFQEQHAVLANEDGHFTLAPHGHERALVLIEAPGYAPSIGFAESHQAGSTDTILNPGSTLHVRFDHADADLVVTLLRDGGEPSPVLEAWQSWIWSRSVEQPEVVWDSLPPGTFRLIGRYADPRKFSSRMVLATVELTRRQERAISVTLPRTTPPANGIVPLFVDLRQKVEGVDLRQLKSTEILAFAPDIGGHPQEIAHAIEQTSGGFLLYLKTTDVASAFCVSTELVLTADLTKRIGGNSIPASIMRRSNLRLLLVSKNGSALPSTAKAIFGNCRNGNEIVLATSVAASGGMELPAPSHCTTLALQLPPFEPVLLQPQLQPGETRNAGTFRVGIGAAASIRVTRDPEGAPVPTAEVRVITVDERNNRVTTGVGSTDDGGRLDLRGVPVHRSVFVEAKDPQSNISGVVQLFLEPGELKKIDPLRIPVPATIVLAPRLAPDFRARFPDATIVSVVLDPAEPGAASRQTKTLGEASELHFDALLPGTWKPTALLAVDGMTQPIRLPPVSVEAGEIKRVATEVRPLVFEGVVRIGDQGFATRIAFREEPSRDSMIRFAQSTADGHFHIILPLEGTYGIQVIPPGERSLIDLGEILFRDPDTPVALQVPAGELGILVTDKDRPAEGAHVIATLLRTSSRGGVYTLTRTAEIDASGAARISYLSPGRWLVTARGASGFESAQKVMDLDSTREVELQLTEDLALEGFVHDAEDSAVRDATVHCLFTSQGGIPQIGQSETAANGGFRYLYRSVRTLSCIAASSLVPEVLGPLRHA